MPEDRNPLSEGLDTLETADLLHLMHEEDLTAYHAVGMALGQIEQAVDDAVEAVRSGGRIVYAGAGTSGRLSVLDASEVPPTFGSNAFEAVIAGGDEAIRCSVEGAEDDREAGGKAADGLRSKDMAVGISASGSTPFVLGFLEAAKAQGARCWMVSSVGTDEKFLDGTIVLDTGPELIAGSTRLKAGTAQKMALNMLSTATMVRLGGTYDGLMVNVTPTNAKLKKRALGIIMEVAGCPEEEAAKALEGAGMSPKLAALMLKGGMDRDKAALLLEESGGSLRVALESIDID